MDIERPNFIYKYHKIDQHLFDLLANGRLWFSHQNELNDPFDCKYALSDSFLKSIQKKSSDILLKDLQEKVPALSKISQDRFFEFVLPSLISNEWMNLFYDMLFGGPGWSVCCFTTNPLNEIMWAHYADSHKGVCLKFDLSKTPQLYENLFPVKYNNTFPEINSMDEQYEALLTKRTIWSKEEEWRILTNVKGKKNFNKESLSAIFFGCNVERLIKDNICQTTLKSGYKKVEFKQINMRIKGVTLSPMKNSNKKITKQ